MSIPGVRLCIAHCARPIFSIKLTSKRVCSNPIICPGHTPHRVQDHIFSMIYAFNIWWNILNILQVDWKEIWGIIFGPEALSSGSYQIFIQITKTKKFGIYLKYFIKEKVNISEEIFGCACSESMFSGGHVSDIIRYFPGSSIMPLAVAFLSQTSIFTPTPSWSITL